MTVDSFKLCLIKKCLNLMLIQDFVSAGSLLRARVKLSRESLMFSLSLLSSLFLTPSSFFCSLFNTHPSTYHCCSSLPAYSNRKYQQYVLFVCFFLLIIVYYSVY